MVPMTDPLFYQMYETESSTYTYLLADQTTKEAIIIDPVLETIDRDLKLIAELDLKLIYVLDTHIHADHITSAGKIREITNVKTCVGKNSASQCADVLLKEGDELRFGQHTVKALETPGHTDGCMTYMVGNKLFTGDALLIRGNGRTDFQQGSPEKLYDSIHKLFDLKGDFTVYPAHDYKGQTKTTLELEKKFNPRIGGGKSKAEFVKIMSELKLANPKKIMEAVRANMACGHIQNSRTIVPVLKNGIPEISVEQLHEKLDSAKNKMLLIDVRTPEEFTGELGHIKGTLLKTLGIDLSTYLQKLDRTEEIIFICRSGARSGQATQESLDMGFRFTANMTGGMIRWNELNYPIEK